MNKEIKQEILDAVDEKVKEIWGRYHVGEKHIQQIIAAYETGRSDLANGVINRAVNEGYIREQIENLVDIINAELKEPWK